MQDPVTLNFHSQGGLTHKNNVNEGVVTITDKYHVINK